MQSVSLKIIPVYSDKPSACIGASVTSSLRSKLGADFQIAQSVWKTELLKSPKLRAMAAHEAENSDIVIVAMREGAPVPQELTDWFNLWKKRKTELPGAFVALLHHARGANSADVSAQKILKRMASRAHMEFFCHSERDPEIPVSDLDDVRWNCERWEGVAQA